MEKIIKAMKEYAESLQTDAKSSNGEIGNLRMALADRINGWVNSLRDIPCKESEITTKGAGKTGGTSNAESVKS
jgi:hypothetical protein